MLKGERVIYSCKPTILAFLPSYLVAISPIVISILALKLLNWGGIYVSTIMNYVASLGMLRILGIVDISSDFMFLVLLWTLSLILGTILVILRISWRPILGYVAILLVISYISIRYGFTIHQTILLISVLCILWLISSDLSRQRHRYYLTNLRIIIRTGILMIEERSIFYSRIVDIILRKGLLGKIFNYGTIIPITASELGTGEETVMALSGVKIGKRIGIGMGGARSIKVPRSPASQVLYGVRRPEYVYKIILENIKKAENIHKHSEYYRVC